MALIRTIALAPVHNILLILYEIIVYENVIITNCVHHPSSIIVNLMTGILDTQQVNLESKGVVLGVLYSCCTVKAFENNLHAPEAIVIDAFRILSHQKRSFILIHTGGFTCSFVSYTSGC